MIRDCWREARAHPLGLLADTLGLLLIFGALLVYLVVGAS